MSPETVAPPLVQSDHDAARGQKRKRRERDGRETDHGEQSEALRNAQEKQEKKEKKQRRREKVQSPHAIAYPQTLFRVCRSSSLSQSRVQARAELDDASPGESPERSKRKAKEEKRSKNEKAETVDDEEVARREERQHNKHESPEQASQSSSSSRSASPTFPQDQSQLHQHGAALEDPTSAFEAFYLRRITAEYGDELEKLRSGRTAQGAAKKATANDQDKPEGAEQLLAGETGQNLSPDQLKMLIGALKQGASIFSNEEMRSVVGKV
ncbi:MAG: hypothetical protein M4579_005535 [Chaenotheca gracillima]|nr:MAG: hypothetical protein M4579_005535 [Chaenotheca gracillima]